MNPRCWLGLASYMVDPVVIVVGNAFLLVSRTLSWHLEAARVSG